MTKAIGAILVFFAMTFGASAQDSFWVQIEARQTLAGAQDRARDYAGRLDSVHGFYIGDGFYGIFIGPFDEPQAETTLARLLDRGAVPSDSFVKNGRFFQQQFWPIGGGAQTTITPPPDPVVAIPAVTSPPVPQDPDFGVDETPAQARASEDALTGQQREDLQRALQWAGHYDAGIDGAFGRGTRSAMQAWQTANGFAATGILTSRQRAALMADYNSLLDGMNMRLVRDAASGIQMQIPTDVVAFTEYQPPFVRFEASNDIPDAKVLFISQSGDIGRLTGLYEIMQILDIVPPDGPRRLTNEGFEIEGVGDRVHSTTTVSLRDGEIKGFTLVWPAGDDARRQRILADMRASFERLDGTLDPAIVPAREDQSIDMVSGLAVRQPRLSRSGFFIADDGAVVTTVEAVQDCERISIDREFDAQVTFADDDLGLALLRPLEEIAPLGVAEFRSGVPRLRDRVAVAGYPFNGVLSAPTLTFGQIVDIRGLTGDDRLSRLAVLTDHSDAGGPVFDEGGTVLGMLLPRQDGTTRVLPEEVNFALDADQISAALESQGITALRSNATGAISPVALTRRAGDIAVLVSCW